jgi:hypothetical protein
MLVRIASHASMRLPHAGLSAISMSPAEKRACKGLVAKGYAERAVGDLLKVTQAGLERATRIY